MKSWFGNAATRENNWAFDWLPKWDKPTTCCRYFQPMNRARSAATCAQGFNPIASFPQQKQGARGLVAQVLVIMDPLHRNLRVLAEPRRVQRHRPGLRPDHECSACRPPVSPKRRLSWSAAGCSGTGRGGRAPGRGATGRGHHVWLHHRLKALYAKGRRRVPDPILNLDWKIPDQPSPEEIAKEYNGSRRWLTCFDLERPDQGRPAGQRAFGLWRLRRRHHRQRLLDLRRLDARRQPDGAARQRRP